MAVSTGCGSTSSLDPSIEAVIGHLPAGLLELATRRWREAETLLAVAPETDASLDARLRRELLAPLLLEPSWPPPTPPRPVAGGWVHCEILEEELPAFEAATEGLAELGPDGFARFCQELRFPVVPYRRFEARSRPRRPPPKEAIGPRPTLAKRQTRPLAGRVVVDLSTHWAGPLCTRLLGLFGASVIKIDPDCRPDGFGERPSLYKHLNGGKQRRSYDLRLDDDRAAFEGLLADADLVVESFSRRVMANLGYSPDELWTLGSKLSTLSIKAFPSGSPEQDWLAYGPGVHAMSGLAFDQERPRPAPLAYPDVLAGLTGFVAAIELLDSVHDHTEVSLAEATAPLLEEPKGLGDKAGGDS